MIFSETYRTNIEDYSRSGKLSLESVLRILEKRAMPFFQRILQPAAAHSLCSHVCSLRSVFSDARPTEVPLGDMSPEKTIRAFSPP